MCAVSVCTRAREITHECALRERASRIVHAARREPSACTLARVRDSSTCKRNASKNGVRKPFAVLRQQQWHNCQWPNINEIARPDKRRRQGQHFQSNEIERRLLANGKGSHDVIRCSTLAPARR